MKNANLKIKRRNVRLLSMKNLVKHLKQNNKCSSTIEDVLMNNFEGFQLDLFRSEAKNSKCSKTQKRYSKEMRKFALTLHFYSPKAYAFVRGKLNLPHSAVLRKWLSSTNCEVGFISEVFQFLKIKVSNESYLKNVALIFDSMAIRKGITYDKKSDKHYGYVDLGDIVNSSSEELATEALVFQIVSFEQKFKCPIAYFFVNKIDSSIQHQLILIAIEKLSKIGITVRSITCDGCISNIKTLNLLGCNLSCENMRPFFKNPYGQDNVYCILDPCHLLKLLRNAFGEIVLQSSKGEISFKYIKKLNDLQKDLDLKFANKLSPSHIRYQQKKMNVRLAAQTISSSVANALQFLCGTGHPDFVGCEATAQFLNVFDRVFDVMNSRSVFASGYKSPMYLNNTHYWSNIFNETKHYISELTADGIPIIHHRRKTFAIGFLMNIISFQKLAIELMSAEEHPLKYFLTYKCSQDHLELYFSCIRSRGSWNDNPNALQFKWTLRRLLFNNSVQPGVNSNCLDTDFNLTPIFESRIQKNVSENCSVLDEEVSRLTSVMDKIMLTQFHEYILYYIAGFVVRKLLQKNVCVYCEKMLIREKSLDHNYSTKIDPNNYASFTNFVNNGKLVFPSKVVLDIVKVTEQVFRAEVKLHFMGKNNFKQKISIAVTQHFINNRLLQKFQPPHPIVDMHEDLHEVQVLKYIVDMYANIRIQTHAKKKTLEILGDKATIRQKLHKTILFYHV